MSKIREILQEKYWPYMGQPSLLSENEIVLCMIKYAEWYAQKALNAAALNAVTFIPTHPHLHGTKNVDIESITKTKLPNHE